MIPRLPALESVDVVLPHGLVRLRQGSMETLVLLDRRYPVALGEDSSELTTLLLLRHLARRMRHQERQTVPCL